MREESKAVKLPSFELNFLDPLHMRNKHSNFQLPTSKTDLTIYLSEIGAILLPKTLPLGELGEGSVDFP